jgi:bacterial/archaeal transporter family-2 protein
MEALATPFLLLVGGLLALQGSANVQLATAMGSPFGASTLQLGIGALLLLALAALGGSLGAFQLLDQAEPWALAGGVGSAVYITAGILLFPRLGALVAVGLFIAGQMLASVLLDGFGWLGVAADPPSSATFVGAAAVVAGAALIVRAQAGAGALEEAARRRSGWIVLALVAGRCSPFRARSTHNSTPSSTRRSRSGRSRSPWRPPQWRSRLAASSPRVRPAPGWPRFAPCLGGAGWAGSAERRT